MTELTPQNRFRIQPRAVLWGLIVLYTLLIPNAIYVYRVIEAKFGLVFAGRIPLVVVVLLGIGYVVYLRKAKLGWKKALYLIPCAVIALAIFRLEDNPNKNIHIPEYILMAWLVYAALKMDYRGAGMLILVYIIASMLGVVDELEQGIHPGRTYGWTDMLVNTSSALMGVFTILGLTNYHSNGWGWTGNMKRFKTELGLILVGGIGAVLMCVKLFEVQAAGGVMQGMYPGWLSIVNVVVCLLILIVFFRRKKSEQIFNYTNKEEIQTAGYWVWPVLTILFYMHFLIIIVMVVSLTFK